MNKDADLQPRHLNQTIGLIAGPAVGVALLFQFNPNTSHPEIGRTAALAAAFKDSGLSA